MVIKVDKTKAFTRSTTIPILAKFLTRMLTRDPFAVENKLWDT